MNKYFFIIYYLLKHPLEIVYRYFEKDFKEHSTRPKLILRLSILLTFIILFRNNVVMLIFLIQPNLDEYSYAMLAITLIIYLWKVLGKGNGSQWYEEYKKLQGGEDDI